jgi:hypothetical protein
MNLLIVYVKLSEIQNTVVNPSEGKSTLVTELIIFQKQLYFCFNLIEI